MKVSAADCRAAFRLIALNVTVIATDDGRGPHGCTATVWAEDPRSPFVATALKRDGATRAAIARSDRFGASVLDVYQTDVARQFARPGDRFAGVRYRFGPSGQPLIEGALVAIECTVASSVEFGTYDLIVGEVQSLAIGQKAPALTFWDGSFRSVRPVSPDHD